MQQASASGIWETLPAPSAAYAAAEQEIVRLSALRPAPRSERLAALHNPWSNTAVVANRWAFLDLCESDEIVRAVAGLIGPDVVLWDSQLYLSARHYAGFVAAAREGRYWPIHPREGAVSLLAFGESVSIAHVRLSELSARFTPPPEPEAPLYAIRYFPGASKYVRNPRFPANWLAMEEQVLVNYTTRALWLVSGVDRAGNDFITGFSEQSPSWTKDR